MPDPIVWTKMGSISEVDSPEIGTFQSKMHYASSAYFRPSVYDDGGSGANASNNSYIKYNTTGMSTTEGCMECWLVFEIQDVVDGIFTPGAPTLGRHTFGIGGGLSSNTLQFIIYGTNNPTLGHSVYTNGGFAMNVTSGIDITKNTPYHVAVTWDNSGIDGSGDKSRLYVNGVNVGASSTKGGPSSISNSIIIGNRPWSTQIYAFYSPSGNWCSLDNFKAWDYAKIDFSDRFTEAGTPDLKRLFSNRYFGEI